MSGKHAICSPSGASGWMNCPQWEGGSTSSKYSREGTAAHELAAKCLLENKDASDFIGLKIVVEGQEFTVDHKMAEPVQEYIDIVKDLPGEVMIEQKLSIEHITGEHGAEGTSDAVGIDDDLLTVVDLKFGQGEEVDAEENEQLQMYADSALEQFSVLYPGIKNVRLMIVQPRINNFSEWTTTVKALKEFTARASIAAKKKLDNVIEYNPGEKTCRWCVKKTSCPAANRDVQLAIAAGFDEVTDELVISDHKLSVKMAAVPFIENWCKAVRAKVTAELLAGNEVEGFKLVAGKKGKRSWSDASEAEKMLKSFRLKQEQMYNFDLISPTAAEKLLKDQERRWAKVQDFIVQKSGKPAVVAVTDKRPALQLTSVEASFDVVEDEE